jgi:lipopolysaccharide transport system permease protein
MSDPAELVEFTATPPPLSRLVRDLWHSRELIAMLARKDFFVRYRRASFGVLWAVGLPFFQAAILAVVFSKIVQIGTGFSYPVFIFSGFVAWNLFSSALSGASTSIVDNSALASKIYFPRAVLPIANVVTNLYGYAVTVVALIIMSIAFGESVGVKVLYLVPATLIVVLLTSGFSLLCAALHVYFRDIRYLIQAALTVWFYVTPVLYPLNKASGLIKTGVKLNPMTGVVELFRAAILRPDHGWLVTLVITGVWILATWGAAVVLHRRFDRVFADLM